VAGPAVNRDVTVEASAAVLPGFFPGNLGIELLEIKDELVCGRIVVDDRHLHPGGYVHGGVWVALADTVAAWGTMRNLPAGELLAIGEPIHRGRRTQVWEVRVRNSDRLAANFICTQVVLSSG
jgi:1,4-dihydroxy-2-naphthoyl-CoA hydrolase